MNNECDRERDRMVPMLADEYEQTQVGRKRLSRYPHHAMYRRQDF